MLAWAKTSRPSMTIGWASVARMRSTATTAASSAGEVGEQHRELVAAEPRGRVAGSEQAFEPAGHGAQQCVAGGVAEAVVDGLEVVQVEQQDRHREAVAAPPAQGVRDAVGEERAVGQPGELVVERLVGQRELEALPLADVTAVEHDSADVLVVEQVGVVDLELVRRPVAVHEQALHDLRVFAGGRGAVGKHVSHTAVVGSMHQLSEGPARHLLGRIAKEPLIEGL